MLLNKFQPYKHQVHGHFPYDNLTPLPGHSGLFYAVDKRLGTPVIIKRYEGNDTQIKDRFIREAALTCHMDNDHIVTGLCWGKDSRGVWLATAREEESLTHYIARTNLTGREVTLIIEQIAQGLLYLKSTGLIASHRDIKPDNILVSKTGGIKIADLGIVLETGEAGEHDSARIAGTYAYMAPEQAANPKSATFKSDVYSLGCVYYEMISGKNPFSSVDPKKLMDPHIQKEPEALPPQVSKRTRKLIESMLDAEPHKRPELSYLAHLRTRAKTRSIARVLCPTAAASLLLLGMWRTGLLTLLALMVA